MKLEKPTYTLPADLLKRFERRIPPGERSRSLAHVIEAWLDSRERPEMRRLVEEGCQVMTEEYKQIDRVWSAAADAVWRDNT